MRAESRIVCRNRLSFWEAEQQLAALKLLFPLVGSSVLALPFASIRRAGYSSSSSGVADGDGREEGDSSGIALGVGEKADRGEDVGLGDVVAVGEVAGTTVRLGVLVQKSGNHRPEGWRNSPATKSLMLSDVLLARLCSRPAAV